MATSRKSVRRRPAQPSTTERQRGFEEDLQWLAKTLKTLRAVKYADATPSTVASELKRIRKATTVLLQTLVSLDLEHDDGQGLQAKPFNWPTVQALQQGFALSRTQSGRPTDAEPSSTYPTVVIAAIKDLRNAAEAALEVESLGRGNSSRRTSEQALIDDLGKNFVWAHHRHFGSFPSLSKSGPIVDRLQVLLYDFGLSVDAAGVLRRAIERAERASS